MEDIQKQVDGLMVAEALSAATAALVQFAPMFWQYYDALVKAGFSDGQALALTVGAQHLALSGQMGKPGG